MGFDSSQCWYSLRCIALIYVNIFFKSYALQVIDTYF